MILLGTIMLVLPSLVFWLTLFRQNLFLCSGDRAALSQEERLNGIPAKEWLKEFGAEELDEIENCLRELRKAKKKKLS